MKNYVQPGEILTLTAPAGGVVAGVGVLIGAIFAVAAVTAAQDEEFSGAVRGVFDLAAETHATNQALAAGDPAYWDATNKRVTKTAAGNMFVGVATEAKVSTSALARIALVPRGFAAGAAIADIVLAAVTGNPGVLNDAATKVDVDARMATIKAKIDAVIAALEAAGVVVA